MDISALSAIVPAQISFGTTMKYLAIFAAAAIVAGLLFRIFLGRRSALNRAICAGIGVLCVYVLTVIAYTFSPEGLGRFLAPLPFVTFSGDRLYIMSFADTAFPVICGDILSLVILVLLYNLTDSMLPDGESTLGWFLLRSLTIVTAMVVHYFVTLLTRSYLPELLVSYGPTILLILLTVSMLAGLLEALLGLLLVAVNPILGFLFHFFFSSGLGKQISKAMLTTGILTGLAAALTYWGYGTILISAAALLSYIPVLLILIALWWILERVF